MRRSSAFTLIELLIVVAIIAILAAIAVPNFLEAQTRSRVSRAQNDMRTISVAMESYQIDNLGYPASLQESPLIPNNTSTSAGLDNKLLSTPIMYLAKFPSDVFKIVAGQSQPVFRLYGARYGFYNGVELPAAKFNDTVCPGVTAYPKTAWMTWSLGPDAVTNSGYYHSLPSIMANMATLHPDIGVNKDGQRIDPQSTQNMYYGMIYDPTNGTVSWGDIYRFAGDAMTKAK